MTRLLKNGSRGNRSRDLVGQLLVLSRTFCFAWAVLVLTGLHGFSAAEALPEELWVEPRMTSETQNARKAELSHPQQGLRSDAKALSQSLRLDLRSLREQDIHNRMARHGQGPPKVGFNRLISGLSTSEQVQAKIEWKTLADGGLASLMSLNSPGASAVRLAIRVESLPEKAELRFFSTDMQHVQVVSGTLVLEAVRKNLAAGDPEDVARTYWSPVVPGDTIGLEIYLPPGVASDAVVISVPSLSHMLMLPSGDLPGLSTRASGIGSAASCNVDISCDAGWLSRGNSVARIVFTDGGYSYLCTGTLLHDAANSDIPYFLTASHCIASQSVASSLNSWWFYRSTACNNGQLNPGNQSLINGATLLAQSASTDTAFLRLNDAPPAGVVYAGWTTAVPVLGSLASGIHHPRGDLQKIAYGHVSGFFTCSGFSANGAFSCGQADSSTGNYANVVFSRGTTEAGSSGSGVFLNDGQYLLGHLYGGDSDCSNQSGTNIYGRFDKSYAAANLGQWLNPAGTDNLSVAITGLGTVTSSPAGINCGASCNAAFPANSLVSLIATPGSGYHFAGWSGACVGSGACQLTMNQDHTVTVQFLPDSAVALRFTRPANGNVTSNPQGLNCGGAGRVCRALFAKASQISLMATPNPGYMFGRWFGCPNPSGSTCRVSMNRSISNIRAIFRPLPRYRLTVLKTRFGAVYSQPTGLRCGNNTRSCSATFVTGTTVSLGAVPQPGRIFTGWTGPCSGTDACVVTMNSASRVGATFQ